MYIKQYTDYVIMAINSYQNDIMTAGCHRITYEEMRNAAQQLGIAA